MGSDFQVRKEASVTNNSATSPTERRSLDAGNAEAEFQRGHKKSTSDVAGPPKGPNLLTAIMNKPAFRGHRKTASDSTAPSPSFLQALSASLKSLDPKSHRPPLSPVLINGVQLDRVKLKHPDQKANNPLAGADGKIDPEKKNAFLVKSQDDLTRLMGNKPGIQLKYVITTGGDFYVFPGMSDGKIYNHAHFGGDEAAAAGFIKGMKGNIKLADAGSTGYETPLASAQKAIKMIIDRLPESFGTQKKPFDTEKHITLGRTPTETDKISGY